MVNLCSEYVILSNIYRETEIYLYIYTCLSAILFRGLTPFDFIRYLLMISSLLSDYLV